ncbi:protein of unknown function (plasmid) [Caballeronia sp. S22]
MILEQVDCVVIGAGVLGLAVARALAQAGREVVILECERAIGTGTSSRNSEVIHAGIYYPPGSAKARLCLEGRRMLYAFCETHAWSIAAAASSLLRPRRHSSPTSRRFIATPRLAAWTTCNGSTGAAWRGSSRHLPRMPRCCRRPLASSTVMA